MNHFEDFNTNPKTPIEDFGVEFGGKSVPQPLPLALKEVVSSFKEMIQSEIRLAKAEVQDTVQSLGSTATQLGIFGVLTVLGVFPLMAFLVIGLGKLFGDNYWLSSLIVAVLMIGSGAILALRAYRAMNIEHLSLPKTRDTLQSEVGKVSEAVHKNVVSIEGAYNNRRAL